MTGPDWWENYLQTNSPMGDSILAKYYFMPLTVGFRKIGRATSGDYYAIMSGDALGYGRYDPSWNQQWFNSVTVPGRGLDDILIGRNDDVFVLTYPTWSTSYGDEFFVGRHNSTGSIHSEWIDLDPSWDGFNLEMVKIDFALEDRIYTIGAQDLAGERRTVLCHLDTAGDFVDDWYFYPSDIGPSYDVLECGNFIDWTDTTVLISGQLREDLGGVINTYGFLAEIDQNGHMLSHMLTESPSLNGTSLGEMRQNADGTLIVIAQPAIPPTVGFEILHIDYPMSVLRRSSYGLPGWTLKLKNTALPDAGGFLLTGWASQEPGWYVGSGTHNFLLLTDSVGSFNHSLLSGHVWLDANMDGLRDPAESGIPNGKIVAPPSDLAAWTDGAGGFYWSFLDTGAFHLDADLGPHWTRTYPAAPWTIAAPVLGMFFDSLNMGFAPLGVFEDLSIYVNSSNTRRGMPVRARMSIKNMGNQKVLGRKLVLRFHPDLVPNEASTTWSTLGLDSVSWVLDSVPNFGELGIYCDLDIPLSYGLDTVYFEAQLLPGDHDTSNDLAHFQIPITGSYDPNDKQVSPSGVGPDHTIDPSITRLEYLIRFQNTGTDTAFTVVLVDTLAPNLLASSLVTNATSHNYSVEFVAPHVVQWTFNNILLPDSATDLPGSQGFVRFSIDVDPHTPISTVLSNRADIYFDFNAPILTNDAWVSYGMLSSVEASSQDEDGLLNTLYGPRSTYVSWSLPHGAEYTLELYDLTGHAMLRQAVAGEGRLMLPALDWPVGLYVASIRSSAGKIVAQSKVSLME